MIRSYKLTLIFQA